MEKLTAFSVFIKRLTVNLHQTNSLEKVSRHRTTIVIFFNGAACRELLGNFQFMLWSLLIFKFCLSSNLRYFFLFNFYFSNLQKLMDNRVRVMGDRMTSLIKKKHLNVGMTKEISFMFIRGMWGSLMMARC